MLAKRKGCRWVEPVREKSSSGSRALESSRSRRTRLVGPRKILLQICVRYVIRFASIVAWSDQIVVTTARLLLVVVTTKRRPKIVLHARHGHGLGRTPEKALCLLGLESRFPLHVLSRTATETDLQQSRSPCRAIPTLQGSYSLGDTLPFVTT